MLPENILQQTLELNEKDEELRLLQAEYQREKSNLFQEISRLEKLNNDLMNENMSKDSQIENLTMVIHQRDGEIYGLTKQLENTIAANKYRLDQLGSQESEMNDMPIDAIGMITTTDKIQHKNHGKDITENVATNEDNDIKTHENENENETEDENEIEDEFEDKNEEANNHDEKDIENENETENDRLLEQLRIVKEERDALKNEFAQRVINGFGNIVLNSGFLTLGDVWKQFDRIYSEEHNKCRQLLRSCYYNLNKNLENGLKSSGKQKHMKKHKLYLNQSIHECLFNILQICFDTMQHFERFIYQSVSNTLEIQVE